jgi:hypothetical protein
MLADAQHPGQRLGSLSREITLSATFSQELLTFISNELPHWRDHVDRPHEVAEPRLTAQLCAHLNSAARRTRGWDILQFRQEEPDENNRGRTLDLAAAPCDATIWIEGRRYIEFDTLLPIECKRLPTPLGSDRDEREYVFSKYSTTGGIQRFKDGNHAPSHRFAAMIGYIQQDTPEVWVAHVAQWITDLAATSTPGWSANDLPRIEHSNVAMGVTVLSSTHSRAKLLAAIELRHLWVKMG